MTITLHLEDAAAQAVLDQLTRLGLAYGDLRRPDLDPKLTEVIDDLREGLREGAAKRSPRPNPMPNTAPPGFAIPEREHARLGPLATFKRLLLDLYGNGKS